MFNNFYSEFIYQALDLKYMLKLVILEFKYKLILELQDQLNSDVKLSNSISNLAKRYLFIYKQIQIIDKIKDKTKLLQLILILTIILLNA